MDSTNDDQLRRDIALWEPALYEARPKDVELYRCRLIRELFFAHDPGVSREQLIDLSARIQSLTNVPVFARALHAGTYLALCQAEGHCADDKATAIEGYQNFLAAASPDDAFRPTAEYWLKQLQSPW